ncbi:hypothetical protein [Parvibacter caecicola]|uniref:hypothetical protein n=1 Tax=Parvibacter caecicola TaxID=747645 RepID=UPI0023F3C47A|nr:hypothetical protein [Parvibacter caecicola]
MNRKPAPSPAPDNYEDIIGLPRPVSRKPPLSMSSRAAQFVPFAALSGHEETIKQVVREWEERS